MRKDIRNSRAANELIDKVNRLDRDTSIMWDILTTLLDVSMCDREGCCRWFVVGRKVKGVQSGVFIGGLAWCDSPKCLDHLREWMTDSMDQDEIDDAHEELARWFQTHREQLKSCAFGKDPEIIEALRRMAR